MYVTASKIHSIISMLLQVSKIPRCLEEMYPTYNAETDNNVTVTCRYSIEKTDGLQVPNFGSFT